MFLSPQFLFLVLPNSLICRPKHISLEKQSGDSTIACIALQSMKWSERDTEALRDEYSTGGSRKRSFRYSGTEKRRANVRTLLAQLS